MNGSKGATSSVSVRAGGEKWEGDARLDAALHFLRALWRLDHALHSVSKRMGKRFGVTGPQRFALRMLGRFGSLSGGEMAELLALHPSTLTGMLKRLEEAGLLERNAADEDARRMVLKLSEKGRRHAQVELGTIEATVREVLSRATPRDVSGAQALLSSLAEALEAPLPRRKRG